MAQKNDIDEKDKAETEQKEKESVKESSIISKIGKIFLLAVGITSQVILAYYIVGHNYKSIHKYLYPEKKVPGVFYEIKDIVVNPANTKGERYLLISLGIELKDQQSLEVMKNNNPVIRDRIITTLSKYSVGQLSSYNGREDLKKTLLKTLNQIKTGNVVRNLFFTEYVMQ